MISKGYFKTLESDRRGDRLVARIEIEQGLRLFIIISFIANSRYESFLLLRTTHKQKG